MDYSYFRRCCVPDAFQLRPGTGGGGTRMTSTPLSADYWECSMRIRGGFPTQTFGSAPEGN